MRVAFYSHDTYGLGHLRRCLKIAGAIGEQIDGVRGLIITGSQWADLFPAPPGFVYHRLLPVIKVGAGAYEARATGMALERVLANRGSAIESALAEFRPDLFVIDNVPCGLAGELRPVLERARTRRHPRIVLALRDIIDSPAVVRAQWRDSGAYEALEHSYDELWVFGDPGSCDLNESYGIPPAVASRAVFCGPVGSGVAGRSDDRKRAARPTVLVTGGGGGDAAGLVGCYAECLRHAPSLPQSEIVLGPDFPASQIPENVDREFTRIVRFCSDLPAAIARADAVVAMAGYNTTCEILEAGTPAVFVPRVWPREEQWLRAKALAATGRAQCLHPETLTSERLWRAVEQALSESPRPWTRQWGAQVAAARSAELLAVNHVAG